MTDLRKKTSAIMSTAGAIPVVNEKGEVSMQKVKVHRYVSGKRPDYAPESSGEEESEEEEIAFLGGKRTIAGPAAHDEDEEDLVGVLSPPPSPDSPSLREAVRDDPRLRRLQKLEEEPPDEEEIIRRHREIQEPEVLETDEEKEASEEEEVPMELEGPRRVRAEGSESEDEELEEELSDEEIERRRAMLKQKAKLQREREEEQLRKEEGSSDEEEEESSEYEETTESEEEEDEDVAGPRLKPVFVSKRDRLTIQEKEKEAQRQRQAEIEARRMAEERRCQTLKIIEDDMKKELEEVKEKQPGEDIMTDDENDEADYEAWKVRELKRIKRDREEKESHEREQQEVDRLRNLTEEERRAELRNNPRLVTNKAVKGKYKFLQKYYHRGAFFLDKEDDVFKRDFSAATLEDVFDKTVLPKVMQVKNFGRSGRTKYTHLVDQDTTAFDSPWAMESAVNLRFAASQAGGMRQVFDRPSLKKRRN